MSVDTRYAFAVSRVRAVEKKLLDRNRLDRMIEAKTAEEALKVLLEAGYGKAGGESSQVHEYENLLLEEHRKLYDLMKGIAPQPEVFNLFLLRNDYHNIKVIIKAELLKLHPDNMLVTAGSMGPARLKETIRSRSLGKLPLLMKKAIEDSFDYYNRTGDPQFIDIILDKACFLQMKEEARESGSAFVLGLVELQIDLANLKAFLRVKKLGKSRDFLEAVLIPGGKLGEALFVKYLGSSLEEFVEGTRFSQYTGLIEAAVHELAAQNRLTAFERLLDNYIMSFVKKAKLVTLGIEPLIGYLVAKETEILNARIVMVGKINDIPAETIRERLREAYV